MVWHDTFLTNETTKQKKMELRKRTKKSNKSERNGRLESESADHEAV